MSDYPSNEIGNLPGVSTFGSDFSYAAWTPGTTVTLCNVPWNNDYRDIVHYGTKTLLNEYLDSNAGPRVVLDKLTYCRINVPVRVNIPFGSCYKYNYLRVVNTAQPTVGHGTGTGRNVNVPDTAQTLYYFILDVKYLAPNTTEIYVQLDVWQTFHDVITFGNCYIERGHIGIANENSFNNNGRDYLTIPEGLDVGNEYVIKNTYEHIFVDNHSPDTDMAVMVMSTTSLYGPYGTVDAPKLTMAQGSEYGGVPNGCDLYVFAKRSDFTAYMNFMADKPWVTQGIVSVTAINYNSAMGGLTYGMHYESLSWVTDGPLFNRLIFGTAHGDVANVVVPELDPGLLRDRKFLAKDWRDGLLTGRYAILKKFLTYPYCAIELTTYSATPIILKPECMYGDDIQVIQKAFMGQPNPRVVFIPYRYNAYNTTVNLDASGAINNDGGEMFDFMTGIFDLPTFSVVNNGYLSYMASNRNSIAFQHSTADWSQQRALGGASVGMENTARDIALSRNLADMQTQSIVGNANLSRTVAGQRALLGGANAVAGAFTGANAMAGTSAVAAVSGVANEAANYAITTGQIDTQSAIATTLNQGGASARQNTGTQNNDTNFKFAQFSAQGDYQNAIAGINAKVQDAKLIQPTTAGQMGGDVFNLVMFKWGVFAKVKLVQPAIMSMIGEYWLRYGYAVNRFGRMPADQQCMGKFTYWKLRETYITSGACPETYRQTIRGIFEKGVTVWNNADDIGNVDIAENSPRAGVTL